MDALAFVAPGGLQVGVSRRTGDGPTRCCRRVAMRMAAEQLPGSLADAAGRAVDAIALAREKGYRRFIVEIDTSQGDMTYTLLNQSMPVAKEVAKLLLQQSQQDQLAVVLPDSGAAAFAKKQWLNEGFDRVNFMGLDRATVDLTSETDSAFMVVAPRASEANDLEKLADATSPNISSESQTPADFLMLNPDMIDMGVTGLSYSARQLRTRVFDTFELVFYLKTLPWGILYREYPEGWTMWQDDPSAANGFRQIGGPYKERPDAEKIDEVLEEANPGQVKSGGFFSEFKKFLRVYTKG